MRPCYLINAKNSFPLKYELIDSFLDRFPCVLGHTMKYPIIKGINIRESMPGARNGPCTIFRVSQKSSDKIIVTLPIELKIINFFLRTFH